MSPPMLRSVTLRRARACQGTLWDLGNFQDLWPYVEKIEAPEVRQEGFRWGSFCSRGFS